MAGNFQAVGAGDSSQRDGLWAAKGTEQVWGGSRIWTLAAAGGGEGDVHRVSSSPELRMVAGNPYPKTLVRKKGEGEERTGGWDRGRVAE